VFLSLSLLVFCNCALQGIRAIGRQLIERLILRLCGARRVDLGRQGMGAQGSTLHVGMGVHVFMLL